jgi:hypothetical protein
MALGDKGLLQDWVLRCAVDLAPAPKKGTKK